MRSRSRAGSRFAAVAAAMLALGACAPAAAPGAAAAGPRPLVVRSTPDGAAVELTDGTRCTTPCTLFMAGRRDSVATISLLGYTPVQAPIRVGPDGTVAPNPIEVTLAKESPAGATVLPAPTPTGN